MPPSASIVTAHSELRRFLSVAHEHADTTGEPAYMPACFVDTAWHGLLARPAQHRAFVQDAIGVDVEHVEACGRGVLSWTRRYEHDYGPLPSVWFSDVRGAIDHDRYRRYRAGGPGSDVEASWDCRPRFIDPTRDEPAERTSC